MLGRIWIRHASTSSGSCAIRSWSSFAILTFSQQAPSRYKTSRPPTKREIQTSMVTLYWIAA